MSAPTRDQCLWMFRTMVLIRRFEEQAKREEDSGRIRSTHPAIGQEAVPTGICAHLRNDDYLLGNHRSHHHGIAKGLDPREMMAELLGKATGTNGGKGGSMHIADAAKGMLGANGVVGSNIPVATGCALAAKTRGTDQVSVVFFGDGAAAQGSLHEAMNLASIWDLPVIFVCENNRYAVSTPAEYSIAGGSVANRAAGYAMPGVTVDGQDSLEMYEVAGEAVARARRGDGPTLIEALTYRHTGHGGFDNPHLYRTVEEEKYHQDRDCILRMRAHITGVGHATDEELNRLDGEAVAEIEEAARFANESPYPPASDLLKDVYVSYPQG